MKFTIYQESRQGKRANNEDRIAYCYSRDALLMIVADGMGGHYYGEVASQIAVQYLTSAFQREAQPTLTDPFLFLHKSMSNAHHAILDFSAENKLKDSPRTTCVACIIQNNIAYWAHAGDSRLFHIRKKRVMAQTRDHSRVRLLLEQGMITEQEAATHPDRNKVYSCLGGTTLPEIEFSKKTPLETGDLLVLCTDGVWGVIDGERIAPMLAGSNLMQSVPQMMSQAELEAGPHGDNLSIVAVRWEGNYELPTDQVISTHTLANGEIQTQVPTFGRGATQKVDLTEDEIEKAIAEIKAAITKFSR
ncbi:MAG TPA: PP2C family serine/threonine-protein phosphatase [Rhodocyclaceae bacterium]